MLAGRACSPIPFARSGGAFPNAGVEVLIPDFQGLEEPLRIVMDAEPDILNHNTETVPRLYRVARSGARYERTLRLLERAKEMNPSNRPRRA